MPHCPEFEEFQSRINIKDTYLVFPVAYLNSPSSMFGHTFLRLKAEDKKNPLLDYAVNFAADADPYSIDSSIVLLFNKLPIKAPIKASPAPVGLRGFT